MSYTFRPNDPVVLAMLRALGRGIALARVRQGLSQEGLEARSGVDQTSISRLEGGKAPGMRLDRFAALIAALDIDELEFDRPSVRRWMA